MANFKDREELKTILGGFFLELVGRQEQGDPGVAHPLQVLNDTRLVVIFDLRDPDLRIFIDCTVRPICVTFDDAKKGDATFILDADKGHEFWLGKVNLAKALVKKDVVALGPVPKLLKLLPTVKKFYPIYAQYLRDHGWSRLT